MRYLSFDIPNKFSLSTRTLSDYKRVQSFPFGPTNKCISVALFCWFILMLCRFLPTLYQVWLAVVVFHDGVQVISFTCFVDTVKSIKLCRKMFLLLSKDDRCRLYLLRLLVEGALQKVRISYKRKGEELTGNSKKENRVR